MGILLLVVITPLCFVYVLCGLAALEDKKNNNGTWSDVASSVIYKPPVVFAAILSNPMKFLKGIKFSNQNNKKR